MSVTLNAGSGGATCGTDTVSGTPNIDYQIVKIGYSVSGTAPTQVSASNPLPVAFQSAQAVLQSGAWTVTANAGSGTFAVSGTVTANIGTTNGLALDATVSGLQVAQGSTTSGQKGALALGAVTTSAPSYTTGQSSPLSLTDAGALRTDASATTQPVSAASLPLPTGAATAAKQPALGTAGTPSADVISVQGVPSMTALKVDGSGVTQPVSGTVTANQGGSNWTINGVQWNGTTVDTNSGTKSAGTLRVVIATDQPSLSNAWPVSQSGSWSVSLTGALPAGTNALGSVNLSPVSGQGWPTTASGSITALTLIKGSSATLGSYYFSNPNASLTYMQVFDAATTGAVTLGTTPPKFSFGIPAGGAANLEWANGVKFSSGIVIAATTTRTGSTAPGSTVDYNLAYS